MLSPVERLSVVYVPGATGPNAKAMAQLEQSGEPVTSWNQAGTTPWPPGFNVLLIDDYDWQRNSLGSLIASGHKPAVIASRDGDEDTVTRQTKYELLIAGGYHFAGLSGQHSIWALCKHREDSGASLLTELPPLVAALPVQPSGTVQLDRVMTPPGQVLRISERASFALSGWCMIAPDQPPAPDLFACARHEETGVTEYLRLPRESRRDVADHFQIEHLLMTGFCADLSPLLHRIGTHSLSIMQADATARYQSSTLFQFALELQPYENTARVGLANRYIRGSGIEIGALQKATQLNQSCQVRYIDRMSLPKLLEHYPEMALIPLQAPDIVDDGQLLEHIAEDSQDFAIANHFLEHCPDPIRSIHNMLRAVRQGGILYLAVPDKRHTFDLKRPVTPYAVLRNAYVSGQRSGRAELFYEWAHLVYNLPPDQAKARAEQLMEEDYSIHYNVWATSDLLKFLMSARHDFQSPFELVAVVSAENETIVLLERTAGRLPI